MGGPATVPTLPDSPVPRAKMTVRGVQQLVSVTPFSVDRPATWVLHAEVLAVVVEGEDVRVVVAATEVAAEEVIAVLVALVEVLEVVELHVPK